MKKYGPEYTYKNPWVPYPLPVLGSQPPPTLDHKLLPRAIGFSLRNGEKVYIVRPDSALLTEYVVADSPTESRMVKLSSGQEVDKSNISLSEERYIGNGKYRGTRRRSNPKSKKACRNANMSWIKSHPRGNSRIRGSCRKKYNTR